MEQHCFDAVPKERLETVNEGFRNATDEIKQITERFSSNLNVGKCRKKLNYNGQFVSEISHYSEIDNIIRMDETKDNEEYAITFRHEYGHFADAQLGRPSMTENFNYALGADYEWYNPSNEEGSQNLNNLLEELENSSAFDSRYLSDILSGVFHNNTMIMDRYYQNGAAYYHHSNSYWDGLNGPEKAVEREVFANLFGIYAENDADVVGFVEKYFPNTTTRFKTIIGGC
ncbi:MAG: hypothetical protein IJB76_04875 [Clostridia bacterium]|nr:hypothetical protein [Clostridia bacterium]